MAATEIFDFDISPAAAGIKFIDGSMQMPISPDKVAQGHCCPLCYACPACGGFEALRGLSQREALQLPGLALPPRVFGAACAWPA